MTMQFGLFQGGASDEASLDILSLVLNKAESVYIKKLAVNDWAWTEDPKKHQGGPFIPHQDRDYGFFPALSPKARAKGEPIFETYFNIAWPSVEEVKRARLVNYRSKGEETHLTGVPKAAFSDLPPASLLVIGRASSASAHDVGYAAVIASSGSPEYDYLTELFEIGPFFRSGFFVPARAEQTFIERIASFTDQAIAAYRSGGLAAFAATHAAMPTTKEMAFLARETFLRRTGLSTLNPFSLEAPGDAVREISRGVEYELFREYELRLRSMQLAKVLLSAEPSTTLTVDRILKNLITGFHEIDKILLSASQQRKSRAGYSFEHHIEGMLIDGGIPHEVQVVIEAKKRPDFVLPSYALFKDQTRSKEHALVLSAKTTLRERWKQVLNEMKNCSLYLATVDEDIAANAIEDMDSLGVSLVVPESLKDSESTVYKKYGNVLTFKDFFRYEVKQDRFPVWAKLGIMG